MSQKISIVSILLPKLLDNEGNFYDSPNMVSNEVYAKMQKNNITWHGIANQDNGKYKDTGMAPINASQEVIEGAYSFMDTIDSHLAGINVENTWAHNHQYKEYKQMCNAFASDILKVNPENLIITEPGKYGSLSH